MTFFATHLFLRAAVRLCLEGARFRHDLTGAASVRLKVRRQYVEGGRLMCLSKN